jgi:hypothetical protein
MWKTPTSYAIFTVQMIEGQHAVFRQGLFQLRRSPSEPGSEIFEHWQLLLQSVAANHFMRGEGGTLCPHSGKAVDPLPSADSPPSSD